MHRTELRLKRKTDFLKRKNDGDNQKEVTGEETSILLGHYHLPALLVRLVCRPREHQSRH